MTVSGSNDTSLGISLHTRRPLFFGLRNPALADHTGQVGETSEQQQTHADKWGDHWGETNGEARQQWQRWTKTPGSDPDADQGDAMRTSPIDRLNIFKSAVTPKNYTSINPLTAKLLAKWRIRFDPQPPAWTHVRRERASGKVALRSSSGSTAFSSGSTAGFSLSFSGVSFRVSCFSWFGSQFSSGASFTASTGTSFTAGVSTGPVTPVTSWAAGTSARSGRARSSEARRGSQKDG